MRIVVLSAGFSTRLGRPKALARVHGLTLLRRTLIVLRPFAATRRIIVVVPPRAASYQIAAAGLPVVFLANASRRSGLSSSVRAAIHRARYSAGTLLVPVDLADLTRSNIAQLVRRWRGSRRKVAARRIRAGPSVPLVLPHALYAHTHALAGDQGLRDVLRRLPVDAVNLVTLPGARFDVDTPTDLERARRHPARPTF